MNHAANTENEARIVTGALFMSILGALVAFTSLSTDIYLPAMPAMAEAAGSVMDRLGRNRLVHASLMNNLSVDCDSHPAKSASLSKRNESRHCAHPLGQAQALGVGSQAYVVSSLDT